MGKRVWPLRIGRCRCARRGGVTIVESAFALPIALLVVFALLDLGLAATRYNALAESARCVARETILHGSQAPAEVGSWGPAQFVGTAADSSPIVQRIQGRLPTMTESLVNVQVTWLDGDNSPHDRVRVEVSYQHEPLVPGMAVWGTLDLRSVSTMHIVN